MCIPEFPSENRGLQILRMHVVTLKLLSEMHSTLRCAVAFTEHRFTTRIHVMASVQVYQGGDEDKRKDSDYDSEQHTDAFHQSRIKSHDVGDALSVTFSKERLRPTR